VEKRQFGGAAVPVWEKLRSFRCALGFAGEVEGVVASEGGLLTRGRGVQRGSSGKYGGEDEKDGGGKETTRTATRRRCRSMMGRKGMGGGWQDGNLQVKNFRGDFGKLPPRRLFRDGGSI
jgi:hypothetical protein